jgi:two-component system, chemotaxis family, chemotaxis protein CheY
LKEVKGPRPAYDLKNLVFLIAERQPVMRAIIREVLHSFGVRKICEESTSESAFETFCTENPDIVTVDWGPEFDGISLLDKIRQDEKSPNQTVPVIMVTPYTQQSQIYAARDAGMTEFLAQPVSAKAIYDHICKIVENPREFIKSKTYSGPDRRWHQMEYDGEERRKNAFMSDDKPNKPMLKEDGDEPSA